mmetsp:Transcript_14069/g.48478  ORF Transcript_14069/g.48478 Transcript_14069/m.48478 type:complete len:231 (-) Transcript_14069:2-694(-)
MSGLRIIFSTEMSDGTIGTDGIMWERTRRAPTMNSEGFISGAMVHMGAWRIAPWTGSPSHPCFCASIEARIATMPPMDSPKISQRSSENFFCMCLRYSKTSCSASSKLSSIAMFPSDQPCPSISKPVTTNPASTNLTMVSHRNHRKWSPYPWQIRMAPRGGSVGVIVRVKSLRPREEVKYSSVVLLASFSSICFVSAGNMGWSSGVIVRRFSAVSIFCMLAGRNMVLLAP